MDTEISNPKSGQALVEFCVCLLGLLAVVGGVFVLKDLCLARMDARVRATREASRRSLISPASSVTPVRNFIREVTEGADNQRYSQDDVQSMGGTVDTFLMLNAPNQPAVLSGYAPTNPLATIYSSNDLAANTAYVSGQEHNTVPLRDFPIIRKLFVDESSVDIEETVWTVRTGDLY